HVSCASMRILHIQHLHIDVFILLVAWSQHFLEGSIKSGKIIVFKVKDRDIPIVHTEQYMRSKLREKVGENRGRKREDTFIMVRYIS
uniref:Uncharacterized protein n=1 Tax=Amphimedon queenslandica TaxID=400682 RepID=A0A1X7T5J6_AMPQE